MDDLAHHTLIHGEINILGWRDWSRRNRRARLDLDRGPRFDRSFMAIRAAVDGLGVCLDSMLLAEQELRTGQLVVVLADTAMTVRGHALITLRSKSATKKVSDFRGWLFSELEQTKEMVGKRELLSRSRRLRLPSDRTQRRLCRSLPRLFPATRLRTRCLWELDLREHAHPAS